MSVRDLLDSVAYRYVLDINFKTYPCPVLGGDIDARGFRFVGCDFRGLHADSPFVKRMKFTDCVFINCNFDKLAFNALRGLGLCFFARSRVTVAKGDCQHGAILAFLDPADNVIRIRAGCRRMNASEARRRWKGRRGRRQARLSLEYLIATLKQDGGKLR